MNNLVNIIIEPGKAFDHIKEKDDWWIPFVALVIVTLIFLWVTGPAMARMQAQQMAQMGIDRQIPKSAELIKYVAVPIATLIGFLFVSLILWFLGNSFGGDWNYIKALDLYSYSSVIQIIRSILNTSLLLVRGIPNITTFRDLNVATGLNLFFSPGNPKLYALFSGIEVFSIWQFVLIAYGVSAIIGISRKKAAIVSVILYILSVGVSVLFARGGVM
jgi:hypothetical protein